MRQRFTWWGCPDGREQGWINGLALRSNSQMAKQVSCESMSLSLTRDRDSSRARRHGKAFVFAVPPPTPPPPPPLRGPQNRLAWQESCRQISLWCGTWLQLCDAAQTAGTRRGRVGGHAGGGGTVPLGSARVTERRPGGGAAQMTGGDQAELLGHLTDMALVSLAGNLRSFPIVDHAGRSVLGA